MSFKPQNPPPCYTLNHVLDLKNSKLHKNPSLSSWIHTNTKARFFLVIVPVEVCTHLKSLKGLHRSHYETDTWKGKVEEANIWISLGHEISFNMEKESLIDWKHSLFLFHFIKGVKKVWRRELEMEQAEKYLPPGSKSHFKILSVVCFNFCREQKVGITQVRKTQSSSKNNIKWLTWSI